MPPTTAAPKITLNTPLIGMDVACAALRSDRHEVLALIDEGKLAWAFNFALELSYRPEPRILSLCLASYQSGEPMQWPAESDEFSSVVNTIFPMASAMRAVLAAGRIPTLRAATVRRQLGISDDHVLKLCDARWLKTAKGSVRHAGVNGSPQIEFSSVVEFLKRRRIV